MTMLPNIDEAMEDARNGKLSPYWQNNLKRECLHALNNDFSVMVRLRSLLLHFFIQSLFLLHRINPPLLIGIQKGILEYSFLKEIQKKSGKCIPNKGCGFLFIEALLFLMARPILQHQGFPVLEQDSPMVTQNSLS